MCKAFKKKIAVGLLVAVFGLSLSIPPVTAHEGHHHASPEARIVALRTIVTLLEYIRDFLQVHGETLIAKGVLMPTVYVDIHTDETVTHAHTPSITLELDHGPYHFHYTRSDDSVVESIIDSELSDRAGLINELIILTKLSEAEIVAITQFPE